jgi:hypothetical protein
VAAVLKIVATGSVLAQSGYTPLHIAASLCKQSTVEALVEAGANPFAVAKSGVTAEKLARDKGATELADFLEACCKSITAKNPVPSRGTGAVAELQASKRLLAVQAAEIAEKDSEIAALRARIARHEELAELRTQNAASASASAE